MSNKNANALRAFSFFTAFLLTLVLAACGGGGGGGGGGDEKGNFTNPGLPMTETQDWLIMYYCDADNDLESFLMTDLNEMESVDLSLKKVKIVALVDRSADYWTGDGNWSDSRAYEIVYDSSGLNNTLVSKRIAIQSLGISTNLSNAEVNMGDGATLTKFIQFCKDNYPATKNMLILTDHGGGWAKKKSGSQEYSLATETGTISTGLSFQASDTKSKPISKAICWDESSNDDKLYMDELQDAVTGMGLTIIGLDACLMGMIEVAYELKGQASYMIASEQTIPGAGWDYAAILNEIKSAASMTAVNMCDVVVSTFGDYYGNGSGTTLAAVDLSKVDAVYTALNTFALSLYNAIDTNAERDDLRDLIYNTANIENYWESKGDDFNVDLYDLADLVQNTYSYNDTDCATLKTAINNAVIYNWNDPTDMPKSHGLAIHLATTTSTGGLAVYNTYCNGYSSSYPVDFVQNSTNKWVPHYSAGSVTGPGLLYRLLFETLP
jgi:hypothetical protein